MTMKDGIKLGIGFTIGQILVNDLASTVVNVANVVYPKLYREVKKKNPEIAKYMDRVRPCEETDNGSPSELKAKIGFEI